MSSDEYALFMIPSLQVSGSQMGRYLTDEELSGDR
jgi:hypothetical protein